MSEPCCPVPVDCCPEPENDQPSTVDSRSPW